MKRLHEQAVAIATEGLRACYHGEKVFASPVNYPAYWARDTFWALPGAVRIGDLYVARECLRYFFAHQKPNGQIPRKVSLDYDLMRYALKLDLRRRKSKAIYSGLYPFFACADSNALTVLAFANYCSASGDREFYSAHLPGAKLALAWYGGRLDREGFVKESALANWMDTVWKNGAVLSTNALYGAALFALSDLEDGSGAANDPAGEFIDLFRDRFWNGEFFDDVLGREQRFDAAGNAIACHFGLASYAETRSVASKMIALRSENVFLPTVDPLHPYWGINPVPRIFGMGDYHNGNSWLWIDALAARVMKLGGFPDKAREYWNDICRIIVRDKAIHETYLPGGEIYGRCYGKSVTPFAWNSGVFLSVAHEFA